MDLKGKRILLACPMYPVSNGYIRLNWIETLKGLSIKHGFHFDVIDFLEYKRIWGKQQGTKLFVDRILNYNKPDILLGHITSDHCEAKELMRLKESGIKTINIFFEGAHCFDSCAKDIISCFDLWTDLYLPGMDRYAALGVKAVWLPVGINSDFVKMIEIKDYKSRTIDVSFVGSCYYSDCVDIMRRICDDGFNVQVCGPRWEDLSSTHPKAVKTFSITSQKEMYEIYANSKIVVNFSDVGGPDLRILRGRDFEATACGAVLVTGIFPAMTRCFDCNEVFMYKSQSDIPDLVKKILGDPVNSEIVAQRGRQRTLMEHTWQNRFEYLLDYYFKEIAK